MARTTAERPAARKKARTKARRATGYLITGAQLAMALPQPRSTARKTRSVEPASAGSYVVVLAYQRGNSTVHREYRVDDAAVFHTILLMLRTGPAYFHEAENVIELASTQPASAPGGTSSARIQLQLP